MYAHLYSNHFDHICALGIEGEWSATTLNLRATRKGGRDRRWSEGGGANAGKCIAHLNTSYRHFFLFVNEVSIWACSCALLD